MQLQVRIDASPEAVLKVEVDAIGQILFNLVDNACKYAANADHRSIHLAASVENQQVTFSVRDQNAFLANLGAITIGDTRPMRIAVTLLADQLSEGSRGGLLAREDQGLFDLSTRAITRHEPVLPRLDGFGDTWTYRLEPYLPMLDSVDRGVPNNPSLLLDFTDSRLTITIKRPDGETD